MGSKRAESYINQWWPGGKRIAAKGFVNPHHVIVVSFIGSDRYLTSLLVVVGP